MRRENSCLSIKGISEILIELSSSICVQYSRKIIHDLIEVTQVKIYLTRLIGPRV